MTGLQQFEFSGIQVRAVVVDGVPWFVAMDVAAVLGYSATAAMTRSMDEDEKGVQRLHTLGGPQQMTVINEGGLWGAALRSTIPQGAAFRRWVTHDVLPAIHRTGAYAVPQTAEQQLASAVVLAQGIIEQRDQQIAVLTPKAEAWTALMDADGDYCVSDAAKILQRAGVETGPQRLFEQMAGLRWIFRGGDRRWRAYQSAVESEYLAELPQSHRHPRTGEVVMDTPQIRITLRGIERLRVRLGALAVA